MAAFAEIAGAQTSPASEILALRTAPLNDQFERWRAEWGDRHLAHRNDPGVVVLNFFKFGGFDIAHHTASLPMGETTSFGFDKIGICRYQRVTLERMTKQTGDVTEKRWVSRFTETIDLNSVEWKSATINRSFDYSNIVITTTRTPAYQHRDEILSGRGQRDFPAKPDAYVIERENKETPADFLSFSAKIGLERMSDAASILMKECPGKRSPF